MAHTPKMISEFQVDAMLCDSAVTAEGKLYIQGAGWDRITPQKLPHKQPRIGLGVVVTIPYTGTNQNHTLLITLDHEDGGLVAIDQPGGANPPKPPEARIEAQFNIGRPPVLQPGDAQCIAFAVNCDGLEFSQPGGYSFVIFIDGTEIRRLPFRVLDAARQNLGAA